MPLSIGIGISPPLATGGGVVTITPNDIFAVPGTTGLFFLPGTEYGECFQETTGAAASTPAGNGDPLGTYHCLVTGKYLTAPSNDARPILTSGGGLWWAAWDRLDDLLKSPTNEFTMSSSWFLSTACVFASGADPNPTDTAIGLVGSSTNYLYVAQRPDIASSTAVTRGSSMVPVVGQTFASSGSGQLQDVPSLNAGEWSSNTARRFRKAAQVAIQAATGFTTQTLAAGAYLGGSSRAYQARTYSGIWLSRNPSDAEEASINNLLAQRGGITL